MAFLTALHTNRGAAALAAALALGGCVLIDSDIDSATTTGDTTGDTTGSSTSTGSTGDTSGSDSEGTSGTSEGTSGTSEGTSGTSEGTTDATTGDETTTTEGTTEGTTGGIDPGFDPDDTGVQMCADPFAQDPYDIIGLGPQITGDTLLLEVAYSGGCAEHDFGLCWDGAFLESDPVQVHVTVGHNGNGDACEAYPMEQLQFDLTELKTSWQEAYQQDSGLIVIHVDGWEKPIEYGF
ncbi:MAG: hypothetical protein R3A79_27950 [Nannocystaceae bacterium]